MSSKKTTLTKIELMRCVVEFLSFGDYRSAALLIWPWYKQNEWSELIWSNIEKHDRLCVMGHGSASKTFTASIWFLLDWISHTDETALILTSATMPSMNARIWADFKTLWTKSRIPLNEIAQIVDSRHIIRKGVMETKSAIHAVAADGDDAQSKIQGIHTMRNRLIIDEADNPYSNSIWNAQTNLATSGHFKAIALANPDDKNSEFGQHCEPVDGWDSINPEVDVEWDSKLGWHVLRLDGLRSPNIMSGQDVHPFLLNNAAVIETRDNKGTNSRSWWTYIRAWYPPDNLVSNIFPSSIIPKCYTPHIWYGTKVPIASVDPAFEGGDNCVLSLGYMGRQASNPERTVVELTEQVRIKRRDMEKSLAFDYADQIAAILKDRGVEADHFASDTTGTQGSFTDVLEEKIGKGILRVNFGGSASERKITQEDTCPAKERYKNHVTELWYVAREWCRLGLVYLKDPPKDLRIQLEARRYELRGKDVKSGREVIMAEPKTDMKTRGLSSPDEADSFVLLIHVARHHALGFVPGSFRDKLANKKFGGFKNRTYFTADYGISDKDQGL